MAPQITDIVNGQGYKANGVQFSLNPATNRFQEASTFKSGLPTDVKSSLDFSSISSSPALKGTMTPAPQLPVDTSLVGTSQGQADLTLQSQQQPKTESAKDNSFAEGYFKRYFGADGDPGVLEQKATETAQLNNQTGVLASSQRLAEIAKEVDANKLAAQAQKQEVGLNTGGITNADNAGFSEQIDRRTAIKNLNLAAESFAVQGKLESANMAVKNAIDAKYGPQEAKFDAMSKWYTINKDILGKEGEKQKALLDAKVKDLEVKKNNEKEISKLIIDASQVAPKNILDKAKALQESGANATQVALALGQYGADYLKNLSYRSQLETDKAQRANIYSQIAERNREFIKKQQLANFQAPPIVNPTTGQADPKSVIASIIKATGGKLKGGQQALDVISSVQAFASRNIDGTVPGLGAGSFVIPDKFRDQRATSNRQDVNALALKVQQWASGASLTEQQTVMVDKVVPKEGDTDKVVKQKANGLVSFMLNQVSADLVGQGIQYAPGEVDLFQSYNNMQNQDLLNQIPSAQGTSTLIDNKAFFNR